MRKAGDNRFIFDVVTLDMTIENIIFSIATRCSGFPTKINGLDDILIRSRAKVLLTLELKRRTFILFRFVSIKDCTPSSYCD